MPLPPDCDSSPLSAGERAWLEHSRHHLLRRSDPRYPELLKQLPAAPPLLFVAGNPDALREPAFAIVGSRNPTAQGLDTAQFMAEGLAERGLCIVSGLAIGIDGAAHRGALAAQGTTIAVLGCGVDVIYPQSHRELASKIEADGALVSAFAPGTPPRSENFPQRNRLIAGMSMGTLVVEAARGSGSLCTAQRAAELRRPVFAVPGSIHNPLSRGCHALIRAGATLTETTHDILSRLNFSAFFARSRDAPAGPAATPIPAAGMDKNHKILLDALGFDPADLDTLVIRSGFEARAVSSMMLILELEGHVQAAPGGRYSRVVRSRR